MRKLVSEDGYLSLLNCSLEKEDGYEEGMRFSTYPLGAAVSDASGIAFVDPFEKDWLFVKVANSVDREYAITRSNQ